MQLRNTINIALEKQKKTVSYTNKHHHKIIK